MAVSERVGRNVVERMKEALLAFFAFVWSLKICSGNTLRGQVEEVVGSRTVFINPEASQELRRTSLA